MIKKIGLLILLLQLHQLLFASMKVKIINVNGEVKIRRGVEEQWLTAVPGMLLEEIDSIQSGKNGAVTLEINSGEMIRLSNETQIDIGDLRKISEQEMMLFLMSNKIQKIEPNTQKRPLRVGSVSVVHGSKTAEAKASSENLTADVLKRETNGVKALFSYCYYTNAVIKIHKMLAKYNTITDCGEIYFFLGKSFEALKKNGQAIDAYQSVIATFEKEACSSQPALDWYVQAKASIKKLTM